MSLARIKRHSELLQKLNQKVDILRSTIKDYTLGVGENIVPDEDISEDEIRERYFNWRQDLLIKYYDPRKKKQ